MATAAHVPAHFTTLYGEIHRLAAHALGRSAASATWQATAVVHEVYLRLARQAGVSSLERTQCFKLAARAMRSALVDHARRRRSQKREADGRRVALDAVLDHYEERALDLVALETSLQRLAERQPTQAQLVELRFFGGYTMSECASALDLSERTAHRLWDAARQWLYTELESSSTR